MTGNSMVRRALLTAALGMSAVGGNVQVIERPPRDDPAPPKERRLWPGKPPKGPRMARPLTKKAREKRKAAIAYHSKRFNRARAKR